MNIQEMKIKPSGPITSWQIDGETMETLTDFIFWGSKITADGDCSLESKRRLLLGRKDMTNLDIILKSRDISLSTKFHLVKAMVFPIVMYRCESWTIKNAEREKERESHSVVSDSLRPHRLYSPWNSPDQNTGVLAFPFSRGSSQPRDQTQVSCTAGGFFTN